MRSLSISFAAALLWLVIGCREATLDAVGLPPPILPDGLVAHWRLDEGRGTVVKDSSGNGHDGQLSGGTWIEDARFGDGVRFGAEDTIVVPGFPAATQNWSVSVWIRLSDEQLATDSETWTTILSTENINSGGWEVNLDRQLAQPRFVFSYWAPPLTNYIGTECSCVETGAFHHLAAVVDANIDRILLYKDGAIVDQVRRPSDVPPGDSTLHFARWNMSGRLLNGDLDDVAIWQRALTAEEVASLTARSP
jgi:hypothetical protein